MIIDGVMYYTAEEAFRVSLLLGILFAFAIIGVAYLIKSLFK